MYKYGILWVQQRKVVVFMLIMSLSQWKEILPPCDCEALDEYFHDDQMELDSPSVLDAIVSYEGGIASGYEVRQLVERVYGIDLWRV